MVERGRHSGMGLSETFGLAKNEGASTLVKTLVPKAKIVDIENIWKYVDSTERRFVNRLDTKEDILSNEDFFPFKENIKKLGLLHEIYIYEKPADEIKDKEKYTDKYIIVSGYRRFCALESIFNDGDEVHRAVAHHLPPETPEEILEQISLAENVQRKNLTATEFAVKAVKSKNYTKENIEKFCENFQFTQSYTSRVLKCMDMPTELLMVLDDIGLDNAITINRIIKLQPERNVEELVHELMERSRDDLRGILRKLKAEKKGKEEERYKIKATSRSTNLTLNRKLDEKQLEKLQKMVDKFLDAIK